MRGDLAIAGHGLQELFRGDDTIEAEAAAIELAGVLSLVRQYFTSGR